MKNFLVKYANLALIYLLLLFGLKTRAKILWLLFTIKQKARTTTKPEEEVNEE